MRTRRHTRKREAKSAPGNTLSCKAVERQEDLLEHILGQAWPLVIDDDAHNVPT